MKNTKHEKNKKSLKLLGFTGLAAGLIFCVIGFADFFSSFGTASMPTKFWMFFVGFPLLAVGGSLLLFGFRSEVARYIKNESVPIINEMGEEISPAIRAVGKAVRGEGAACECGKINDRDAKFCEKCGKRLSLKCKQCGSESRAGADFCKSCGAKFEDGN